jgi:hypothetical protein
VSRALAQEELAVATRQHPCTLLCACPRGAGKTTDHCFATPSILTYLAPCDFFFFPRLNEKLCGRQFQSAEIVTATREAVWDLPANIFEQCFQQLYQHWQTCMAANGDYFEGGCGYV